VKIFWAKEALLNLQEIQEYISRDNPVVALEFLEKLISITDVLIDFPSKGRIVPELSLDNIRELIYKNYRIVYLHKKNSIDILTVFEGHQLLKKDEILRSKN
jgi:toxin ParE1/3/4